MSLDSLGNGYNPLRWDCEKKGCFNKLCRPKIEVFADCFPRRINFGDVDGIVEINGIGLMLEWKTGKGSISVGQRIMYEKLTKTGIITVLCVVGNAETMECRKYCLVYMGKKGKFKNADLAIIKNVIRRWVVFAEKRKNHDRHPED